jgi:hypothetical protein
MGRGKMDELKDYSGPYISNLKLEDFSKETLVKLWQGTSKLFMGIAGIYLSDLRAKDGDKIAYDMDSEVWRKMIPLELKFVTRAMNIQGNDVATVFKFLQCYACAGGQMDMELDLKNKNHGILTVKRCRPLEYLERNNEIVAGKHMCDMDLWGWQLQATIINPDIKVTCLKMPPRKSGEEITCQWEYKQ